ncbi:hypothetical protein [Niabella ginsenosidivorans]|nr:hypothetical protein [Niabella ginsenosidivorans]
MPNLLSASGNGNKLTRAQHRFTNQPIKGYSGDTDDAQQLFHSLAEIVKENEQPDVFLYDPAQIYKEGLPEAPFNRLMDDLKICMSELVPVLALFYEAGAAIYWLLYELIGVIGRCHLLVQDSGKPGAEKTKVT